MKLRWTILLLLARVSRTSRHYGVSCSGCSATLERERLERERGRLERERERLRQENEKLKKQLEEAQRAAKRQAAPFSRGTRKANPKPPGRKPGSAYGQHRRKAIPQKVDEVIAVPVPTQCDCGGELEVESIESQYQQEIHRTTFWRRLDIPICRCRKCQKRG